MAYDFDINHHERIIDFGITQRNRDYIGLEEEQKDLEGAIYF